MAEDRTLQRPDGRLVAWMEDGPDACPDRATWVMRLPGTPASRRLVPPAFDAWKERLLRVIATERPGFGASTRLPEHGFTEHADDLAAILDEIGLEQVPVFATGTGAPYLLALASRHPDRVSVGIVTGGLAPTNDDDIEAMIPLNREGSQLVAAGDRDGLESLIRPVYEGFIADPLSAVFDVTGPQPEADKVAMSERTWQQRWIKNTDDALYAGLDGWLDECLATGWGWDDLDLSTITAPILWFHAIGDPVLPISAARRLVSSLPTARLHEWPADAGALYGYEHEAEVLDAMLELITQTAR